MGLTFGSGNETREREASCIVVYAGMQETETKQYLSSFSSSTWKVASPLAFTFPGRAVQRSRMRLKTERETAWERDPGIVSFPDHPGN